VALCFTGSASRPGSSANTALAESEWLSWLKGRQGIEVFTSFRAAWWSSWKDAHEKRGAEGNGVQNKKNNKNEKTG